MYTSKFTYSNSIIGIYHNIPFQFVLLNTLCFLSLYLMPFIDSFYQKSYLLVILSCIVDKLGLNPFLFSMNYFKSNVYSTIN